jgi:hypothetical protein
MEFRTAGGEGHAIAPVYCCLMLAPHGRTRLTRSRAVTPSGRSS